MAKRKSRANTGAAFGWRLLLFPFALGFYWLLSRFLDYNALQYPALTRILDALGNPGFLYNILIQLFWLTGLCLIVFARKRWITGLGMVLFLMPAWYIGDSMGYIEGAKLYKGFDFLSLNTQDLLKFLLSAPLALWALIPVRGGKNAAWLRPLIAVLLLADNLYCGLIRGTVNWLCFLQVLTFAAILGWAVDWTYNGFGLASVLPAVAALAELLLWNKTAQPLILVSVLAAAGIIALLCLSPRKRSSFGGIALLSGMILNNVLITSA